MPNARLQCRSVTQASFARGLVRQGSLRLTATLLCAVASGTGITAPSSQLAVATMPIITVTGHRLADYAAVLKACVAAHCPPRQDIVASIRYAEALFKTGDYHGARDVLAKSTRRNADAGAQEPLALSQLYLAQANVAMHFGEQRDVRSATLSSAQIADTYLPVGDADRLSADLRAADWRLSSQHLERDGNPRVSDASFARIAAAARLAGHPDIAAAADLHYAWALHGRRADDQALLILTRLTMTTDEATRPYRLAARVLTARIARDRGDKQAIDATIAAMRAEPDSQAPVLVYNPPFPSPTDPAYQADPDIIQTDRITRAGELNGLQWVDIGFAIRGDGRVDDPMVLRGSHTTDWVKPLLTMIAARRYSPTTGDEAAPGHYRVERFTLTADFTTPIGSLIRRRIAQPHFEHLDLTDVAPPRSS